MTGAVGKVEIQLLSRDFQAEWESPAFGLFHAAAFSTALLPTNSATEPNFLFNFVALNGFWAETVHVRRVDGKWLQAIIVTWNDAKPEGKGVNFTPRRVFSDADEGYPRKNNGEIDWNY